MKTFILKKWIIGFSETIYDYRQLLKLRIHYRLNIMNWKKTLEYIEDYKCSIARFGDGEIDLMMGIHDLGFQEHDDKLVQCLQGVLSNDNKKLLKCVTHNMNSVKGLTKKAKKHWISWGKWGHQEKVVGMIRELTGNKVLFGDASITRPYIDWKSKKHAGIVFNSLKKIWKDRDILIVEGALTRMGVGNDLFSEAKSIGRVLAPAINAFSRYDEIVNALHSVYKGQLILLALGPTATVLASDLADMGLQALDIGHIDIEYEWYKRGAKDKTMIEGKYVNEAGGIAEEVECNDELYLKQIVAKII